MLEYLVNKTLQGEQSDIKETTVAIEVFARGADFDGRIDNIVRVHAHRLRKLLEVYYQDEGAHDKIRISIPKGAYVAEICSVTGPEEFAHLGPEIEPAAGPVYSSGPMALAQLAAPSPRARRVANGSLVASFLFGALFLYGVLWYSGRISAAPGKGLDTRENLRSGPLSALWNSVLQPGVKCVISFTNPVFLWMDTPRSRVYMTYRGPVSVPLGTRMELMPGDPFIDPEFLKSSSHFFFSDSWTGTGEVMAVQKLTRLFSEANFPLKVVRSRALSYSETKGANVIFLGSPWANDMQDKIKIGTTPLVCRNNEAILNLEPKSGEPASFVSLLNPQTGELIASYGLFSVLPGISPNTKMIISAGLTTYATSAAIEYMTTATGIQELMKKFGTGNRTLPEFFQAIIRTELIKGEPTSPTLVLVRSLAATTR